MAEQLCGQMAELGVHKNKVEVLLFRVSRKHECYACKMIGCDSCVYFTLDHAVDCETGERVSNKNIVCYLKGLVSTISAFGRGGELLRPCLINKRWRVYVT